MHLGHTALSGSYSIRPFSGSQQQPQTPSLRRVSFVVPTASKKSEAMESGAPQTEAVTSNGAGGTPENGAQAAIVRHDSIPVIKRKDGLGGFACYSPYFGRHLVIESSTLFLSRRIPQDRRSAHPSDTQGVAFRQGQQRRRRFRYVCRCLLLSNAPALPPIVDRSHPSRPSPRILCSWRF